MFEHFHAGHDIKTTGLFRSQCLCAYFLVFNPLRTSLKSMQLGHFQCFGSQVNAQHFSTFARHCIGQYPTTAANIQHPLTCNRCNSINPSKPQWINFMQGPEFTFHIPPAMCEV